MGSQGDEVGQISDVVLDKQSGCMAYVVLATDQGGTRKLVAAPWGIFNPGADNRTYTVTVDRQKIYSAPVWESSRIDEYSRADWIGNVYSYYGVQPQQGLNIQANVGVNTQRREETNVNSRVRQTDRTVGQGRENMEERNTRQHNADMLTQPSPGGDTRQSAESQNEQTRTDSQSRRQERRERRQQRAEQRSSGAESSADETHSSPNRAGTEDRAEGQSQPGNTSEPSEHRSSDADRPMHSGDMDQNRHQTQSSAGQPAGTQENRTSADNNAPSTSHENRQTNEGTTQTKAHSHSHADQQSQQPGAHASPTP